MDKLLFALPESDGNAVAKIIHAVPDDWAWLDGALKAPEVLLGTGQVACTVGYHLSQYTVNPIIVGVCDRRGRCSAVPDVTEILLGKLPRFVHFTEAGFQTRSPSFREAKKVAAHFVALGYHGWLSFSRGCYRDYKHQNPASCQMTFSVEPTDSLRENWQVEIDWQANYGGKAEYVDPLVTTCRALGLKEFSDN